MSKNPILMLPDSGYLIGSDFHNNPYEVGGYVATNHMHLGAHCNHSINIPLWQFDPAVQGANQELPNPLGGFEFQTMESCPRNFIIFDRIGGQSRVMFHPTALSQQFGNQGFDPHPAHENIGSFIDEYNDSGALISSLKEDSDEIDALISSESESDRGGEQGEGEDDDLTSTGRTPALWGGCTSRDSSSSGEVMSYTKSKLHLTQSACSSCASRGGNKKRVRIKKMVDTLKEIIPGGEKMGTLSVLDEAVKYLRSLKTQATKLGIKKL